jgi:hypothetical protein
MVFLSKSAARKMIGITDSTLFAYSFGANSQHDTFPRERFSLVNCVINVVRAPVFSTIGISGAVYQPTVSLVAPQRSINI